jgi:hypothetical protein
MVQIGRAPKRRLEELQALACDFARVKYSTVAEEPFWREIKRFYERAPLLFEETDQWLRAEHD